MSVHTIPLLLADILAFHDELEKEFADLPKQLSEDLQAIMDACEF